MSLKLIRIARLKKLAGERGPVEFGRVIGRKTNQTSDLLAGRSSFGEKVARAIEEYAGLPEGWLDQDDDLGVVKNPTAWPFALLTPEQLRELPPQHLETVEKVALDLWRTVKVPVQSTSVRVDTEAVPRRNGLTGTIPKPDFMKEGSATQRSQSKGASRKTGNG